MSLNNDKKVLAIFDFCNTLIDMQTANAFITKVHEHYKNGVTIANEWTRMILQKTGLLKGLKHKKFQLKQINGLTVEEMDTISREFLNAVLLKHENKCIIDKLIWHQKCQHEVVIVSAGYSVYIKKYAEFYGIDHVIATDLEVQKGKYTGKILGLDCMGLNKLKKLYAGLPMKEYDLKESFVYADSVSDLPLLASVGHPIVIECGQDTEWAKLMNYPLLSVKK